MADETASVDATVRRLIPGRWAGCHGYDGLAGN